jgi:hypothetical protein
VRGRKNDCRHEKNERRCRNMQRCRGPWAKKPAVEKKRGTRNMEAEMKEDAEARATKTNTNTKTHTKTPKKRRRGRPTQGEGHAEDHPPTEA